MRIAILILLLGGGMIAGDLYLSARIDAEAGWQVVDGSVVRVNSRTNTHHHSDGSTSFTTIYTDVVSYQVGGQTYQTEAVAGTDHTSAKGSARQVRYDPNSPSHASIVGDQEASASKLRFYGIITLAVGAVILIAGLGGGAVLRRRR